MADVFGDEVDVDDRMGSDHVDVAVDALHLVGKVVHRGEFDGVTSSATTGNWQQWPADPLRPLKLLDCLVARLPPLRIHRDR